MSCADSQLALRHFVYLAYIDDSDFVAKKEKSTQQEQEQFQVLCAVLVRDNLFSELEMPFSTYGLMGYKLPEAFSSAEFEFHPHDLFHGFGIFTNCEQPKRFQMFEECLKTIRKLQFPVLYGAVDRAKLAKQIYKSANPLDMSFRLCIEEVQKWFKKYAPRERGLLIADSFDEGKKRNLKNVFRENRKKFSQEALELFERASEGKTSNAAITPSTLLDDMYFGDSRDSVGIQAADLCAFLVRRHLARKDETEWLYSIIEPNVVGSTTPE